MPRKTKAELNAEQEDLIQALMEVPEYELACRDPGLAHQWNLTEDFHVTQGRYRRRTMSMVARNSECGRCGKQKQERWIITKNDILQKVANAYSKYEVPMTGFSRGKVRASAVWTAGWRRANERAATEARKSRSLKAV